MRKKEYSYIGAVNGGGLCDKMNFASAEAYKMLRTKLNLIIMQNEMSDAEKKGKIMGITSALRGEGKTTTSINLGYTMAETGNKVCIIEADMRLPNVGKRLSLKLAPGLSNLLTGQVSIERAIQKYSSKEGNTIYCITGGDIPPKPSELLESERMKRLLTMLRDEYDYILLDLPPVTVVTDAISVSPYIDGMLLVVRQDHCDKNSLRDAIYQFKLTKTNVLGVVFNCSNGSGRKRYYRDGKRYYRTK